MGELVLPTGRKILPVTATTTKRPVLTQFLTNVFLDTEESVSVFLSEVLDSDGCVCRAVKVNEV